MQIPISEKVSKILDEAELISWQEKQNLFWLMLEKFGNENIFSYQYIAISEKPSYFLTFQLPNPIKQKRVLGSWKNKISYIAPDFNEPLDDLADYM